MNQVPKRWEEGGALPVCETLSQTELQVYRMGQSQVSHFNVLLI